MRTEQPKVIHLKDYQAPEYLIDETHLTFELYEDRTLVHAQLVMRRNPERPAGKLPPLELHGQRGDRLPTPLKPPAPARAHKTHTQPSSTGRPRRGMIAP